MRSASPAADFRVLLSGYGNAGRILHAPLVTATPGLRLAGVVTTDAGRRAAVTSRYPDVVVGDSVENLLSTRHFDLVVVASANVVHVDQAIAAITAGVPVVVDKPLAATAREARELVATAHAKGVPLTVFQNRRWDNDIRTVRHLIEQGALGTVFRFESSHDRWNPQPQAGWREAGDPAEAGGLLYDVGAHLIDQALQMFGAARDVYAELDIRRPGAAVDDDTFVALTHESGVRSHLSISLVSAQRRPRFHVHGDRAAFVKYGFDPQEDALAAGGTPGTEAWGTEPASAFGTVGETAAGVTAVESVPGSYQSFYGGVVNALRGAAEMPVDPMDAVATLEVIEAAQQSSRERRLVRTGGGA